MVEEYRYRSGEIFTGEQYHEQILGSIDVENPEYKRDLEKVKESPRNEELEYYVNFRNSLDLVRRYQPLKNKRNPTEGRVELDDPQKDFLSHLRNDIIDKLEEYLPENLDLVRVYTAEGSTLDYCHGTDVVIDIDGKIITLDITLKRKDSFKKADIIDFGEIPDPKDKELQDEYKNKINKIGNEISAKFLKGDYRGSDKSYPL